MILKTLEVQGDCFALERRKTSSVSTLQKLINADEMGLNIIVANSKISIRLFMEAIKLQWDFQDETANSTINQINRQKSARNLIIRDFDASVPHAVFFDPKRDNTHRATLTQCECYDFTRLKVPRPCMHIYRLAIELGLLEAKYLDRRALSSVTAGLSREETNRLQQLPTDPKEWGNWASEIHASGIQRNRQYRGYSIHHVERAVVKAGDGWLIHQYPITLEYCGCADFSERRLPCKHIYAAALASGINVPFTFTEFQEARDKGLELVFDFRDLQVTKRQVARPNTAAPNDGIPY
jgi:hypothetical protein